MSAHLRLRRSAGISLVEVVVATALLAMIAVSLLMVTIPIVRSSSDTTAALDMDTKARIFFAGLRPELRQSGFGKSTANDPTGGGTLCFDLVSTVVNNLTSPPTYTTTTGKSQGAMYFLEDTAIDADAFADKLTYRKRLPPATNARADDDDWSNKFVLTLEDQSGQLAICRETVNGDGTVVGLKTTLLVGGLGGIRYLDGDGVGPPSTVPGSNGDGSISVILTLECRNPNIGQGPDEPTVLRREYSERIQLMNRQ